MEPPPGGWKPSFSSLSAAAAEARTELGLPTDRPIVMSGHQAEFWHPGIAAKWFASQAIAERAGACFAWVVVDQDTNDPTSIRYPTQSLAAREVRLDGAQAADPHVPTGCRGPVVPGQRVPDDAHEGMVRDGLNNVLEAMAGHRSEVSLARQIARACQALLDRSHCPPAVLVYVTQLARTQLMAKVVRRMRQDPGACIGAYNRAVAAHPHAHLRPLASDDGEGGGELPLWGIEPGKPRVPVHVRDLARLGQGALAPRALLLTAMLRSCACDLFIHGLGGGLYDRAMEQWIRDWAGGSEPIFTSPTAPTAVVSATRFLPMETPDIPSPEQIHAARWRAHHARHDPAMLGDADAAVQKRQLIEVIRGAARLGAERAEAYSALHRLLAQVRAKHAADLSRIAAKSVALSEQLAVAKIRYDRTWGFPLYGPAAMDALRGEIAGAIARDW